MLQGVVYPLIVAAVLTLSAFGWKYRRQTWRNVHNGFWWSLWKIRIIKRETYIKRTRHIIAIIGDDTIYDRD